MNAGRFPTMRTATAMVARLAAAILALAGVAVAQPADPLPIRVVVVTAFEVGDDSGDGKGELQNWVERFPLPVSLPFPAGYRALRHDPASGVLAIVTGEGTARAASSIMALGLDPRFDLTRAYWVVAGIAGADPLVMSPGSAAWAQWVIDGDLAYEIDAREIPSDWSTGYVPLHRTRPFQPPVPTEDDGGVHRLDAGLVAWAYELTRDTPLPDDDALRAMRAPFKEAAARAAPQVLLGDTVSAETFWHGAKLTEWARDWVTYWSGGAGRFATSAMEDAGTLQALTFLGRAGRVDPARVLVLRTASNFTVQAPGLTAAESLALHADELNYSAFHPALEAAYRVGSRVVRVLSDDWDRVRDRRPGQP